MNPLPRIHLGGTPAVRLMEDYAKAYEALIAARHNMPCGANWECHRPAWPKYQSRNTRNHFKTHSLDLGFFWASTSLLICYLFPESMWDR